MKLKIGQLQTTSDINQKFSMGFLTGNEVWALEERTTQSEPKSYPTADEVKSQLKRAIDKVNSLDQPKTNNTQQTKTIRDDRSQHLTDGFSGDEDKTAEARKGCGKEYYEKELDLSFGCGTTDQSVAYWDGVGLDGVNGTIGYSIGYCPDCSQSHDKAKAVVINYGVDYPTQQEVEKALEDSQNIEGEKK